MGNVLIFVVFSLDGIFLEKLIPLFEFGVGLGYLLKMQLQITGFSLSYRPNTGS